MSHWPRVGRVLALPFGPPSGPATGHQVAVSLIARAASLIHEEITDDIESPPVV